MYYNYNVINTSNDQMKEFIGRASELEKLNSLHNSPGAKLVIIRGRRRIGKSRLVKEFAKNKNFYRFMGLAPKPTTTAQSQRDEFAIQLARETNLPEVNADDWGKLFYLLSSSLKDKEAIILLDEISWMGSKDSLFLSKLKTIWDTEFSENPNLTLILCGSVSSWIEENIISSTGFFGRPSAILTLNQLSLAESVQFWGAKSKYISSYEKFKVLCLTGGVPRYLELIEPKLNAEDNIRNWCFNAEGILLHEFHLIFSDIFGTKSTNYARIVSLLAKRSLSQEEIRDQLKLSKSGILSEYLNELTLAGFIARDFTWDFASGQTGKLSKYRLKDNYMRFYLRYIEPNLAKIEKGLYESQSLSELPQWNTIIGLQFENLVIHNRRLLLEKLNLTLSDVVFDNPYFQRKTARQRGCQIDYLIQTKTNTLYICEIKFSKYPISTDVIKELEEKASRLTKPKSFSIRVVLIHVNGVAEELEDHPIIDHIVDFSEMLQTKNTN